MSIYIKHTNVLFHVSSSSNIYPENIKNWYLVYRKGLEPPWKIYWNRHVHCFIFRLFYWWSNRHPSSSGKWQCTVKKKLSPWVLHIVLSRSNKQSSQVNVSLISFLQTSPVVRCCVMVLIRSPLKNRKRQQWMAWMMFSLFMCGAIHQAACPWNQNRSVL